MEAQAQAVRDERGRLADALAALPEIVVFPSAANFLLIRVQSGHIDAENVFAQLLARKVLIKNVGKMHPLLKNCLRVTVATPEAHTQFLQPQNALTAQ